MEQEQLTFRSTRVHPRLFWVGSCRLSTKFLCVVLLCFFKFLVPCCDVRCDSHIKAMCGSSLHYLCLFAYSGGQHILCCVIYFVCFHLVFCVPIADSLSGFFLIAPFGFLKHYVSWQPNILVWHIMRIGRWYYGLGKVFKKLSLEMGIRGENTRSHG